MPKIIFEAEKVETIVTPPKTHKVLSVLRQATDDGKAMVTVYQPAIYNPQTPEVGSKVCFIEDTEAQLPWDEITQLLSDKGLIPGVVMDEVVEIQFEPANPSADETQEFKPISEFNSEENV